MLREVPIKEEESHPWVHQVRHGAIYGISNRIWVIVGGVLSLIALSRLIFSPTDPVSLYRVRTPHGLISPTDYLNASASEPAPFDFCPVFGPGDEVAARRGQWGLLRSRLHMGSGARVQRVVQRAMAGLPVTISVLGGSGDDPVAKKCYPSRFFEWWNSVFPHPNSELTNGAARRSDSAYFSYCSMHHLPDETDLIIVEFDASDPNDPRWLTHFELLIRSLLVRADSPAVIILGHFSPQVQAQNGFAGPELLHTVVAQFYDVPHISAKGLLYHSYLTDPEGQRTKFYADPVLANTRGHELIADVLISYMQSQICAGWAATMGHGFDVPYMGFTYGSTTTSKDVSKGLSGGETEGEDPELTAHKMRTVAVPQAMLGDRPSDILKFREVDPFCVSANDLINPLPPSYFDDSGWEVSHPKKGVEGEYHHWFSTTGGSRFRIPVELSAGEVTVYYLQSPSDKPQGKAACWVDDNVGGAMELSGNADVHDTVPTMTKIDENVSAGEHYVECSIIGEEGAQTPPFRILGIGGKWQVDIADLLWS